MATGAGVIKRRDQLKTARQATVDPLWRECYQFTFPERGVGFFTGYAGEEGVGTAKAMDTRIFDGTAGDACITLASALVSGMTPANTLWAGIEIAGHGDAKRVNDWLEKAAKETHQDIHGSNFDSANFEAMLDVAVAGMPCLFVEETPQDATPFSFEVWPLTCCFFAASKPGGMIDMVWREYRLTAEQAVAAYGDAVSDRVRKALATDPGQKFDFVLYIGPRDETQKERIKDRLLPFERLEVESSTKNVVKRGGFHEFPVAAPRWLRIPDSVYATGPMKRALPDTKTLNDIERLVLANADMAIGGMWGAVDDGVLNPKTVRIGARRIVAMRDKGSMFPLQSGGRFDVAAIQGDQKRKAIRRIMMADQLEVTAEGPAKTATEIHYRQQLLRQLLGPMYGRLQTEYVQTVFFRCFFIKLRRGDFGQLPPELQGQDLRLKYTSPLARSQKLEDVGAMDRYEQDLLTTTEATQNPALLDNYKWDEGKQYKASLLGVPAHLIPTVEEIAKKREERQKAQAESEQRQAMAAAAGKGGSNAAAAA